METSRVAEESGPDEDLQLKSSLLKVIDADCPEFAGKRGVISVDRTDPIIEKFLSDVPNLLLQNDSYGLIWDKNLKPDNLRYEKGEHFVSTREADRKTNHATVSFYRDGVTGARFAIKTLQKATTFYPEEIRVGLTIQHPNICSVYGIIIRNGTVHILLEHAGSPLYQERVWIAECPQRALSFAQQSFQALDIIHGHGFVHCDIKPDNIMIDRHNNNKFTVKLIDFGTCHTKGARLSSTTANTTFLYWSPEIWQALANQKEIICRPAMDVYALALTLHFVHTSSHLMQRFKDEDLKNVMMKTPDDILLVALPETIPSDLSVVVKSCLDGNHETRSSAQEALKLLTDHALMRWSSSTKADENYKDSFTRMCSSINRCTTRHTKSDTSNTDFKILTASRTSLNSSEKDTSTSSSISGEKRELKASVKARKISLNPANKFNKPSHKGKKAAKLPPKLCFQTMSLESLQAPLVSTESDLEKTMEIKLDDKDYSYSALLKNLALHVKEPHQVNSSYAHCKSTDRSEVVHSLTTDSATETTKKGAGSCSWPENPIISKSTKFSGNKPKPRNEGTSLLLTKHTTLGSSVSKEENVQMDCQTTSNCSIRVQEGSSTANSGVVADDMGFVFSAFGDTEFAAAEDILDNWLKMIDEQKEPSCDTKQLDVNAHQTRTIRQDQIVLNRQDEPMDTDSEDVSVPAGNIQNNVNIPATKGNRKRLADSSANSSGIPGKAVFLTASQQEMNTKQLPDFDQILPENI
ncbi:unnamed protein product [Candidula unifasciata]|uniref:Protein kinase domain-containing protein n=1 Tax=Candidula unifasciata TaxID=100452 RepID=A0A8S4A1C7_9EUPU|nr:unnamed protein product [Candidula unifasciata]